MNMLKNSPFLFIYRPFLSFLQAIIKSLSDLDYYVDILNSKVKRSLKIIAFFYLLLGIVLATLFSTLTLPIIRTDVSKSIDQFEQHYPSDLVVQWNGETLQSNIQEPIFVPFPSDITLPDYLPEHALIFDPRSNQEPNQSTASLLYLNQTQIYSNSLRGMWNPTELSSLVTSDNITIDSEAVVNWLPGIRASVESFLSALPALMFIYFSLGLFLRRVLMIAINSIIVQFLFMLMGKNVPYKKVFQLSLHTLIPIEVLTQLTHYLYPNIDISMPNLAYWSLMALIMYHLRNLHVVKFEKEQKK